MLPTLFPDTGANAQQFAETLGNIGNNAVQLLQGQVVRWAVGVFVAGASGSTLSPSRVLYFPAVGHPEAPSPAFRDLKTVDASNRNASDQAASSSSSVVALEAEWSARRGQPGTYITCFVLNIPLVYGPAYQQEGCACNFPLVQSPDATMFCRCYAFSVLPCAVVAVEGDTLYQIGHSHGVSYIGILLLNTHLQATPHHLVPGDIVATTLIHRVGLPCPISVLADAMLLTPQQLRCDPAGHFAHPNSISFNSSRRRASNPSLASHGNDFMVHANATVCIPIT